VRNSRPLDALLPATRQEILGAVLLQPEREWYLSDLAAHLRRTPSSLQRDLARLTGAGILRRRRDGNRVYFQADSDCPIFPELRQILIKTAGLADVLRDVLTPFRDRIRVAFVHGSVARGEEASGSDVDLLVIGRVGLANLARPLREASRQLGRTVNPTVYSPEEFAQKASGAHHFVSKVIARPKLFVMGDENDLGEVVGREARGPRAREQAGAR
jgi:DNA-binding transcriptional ArsR family regulator